MFALSVSHGTVKHKDYKLHKKGIKYLIFTNLVM